MSHPPSIVWHGSTNPDLRRPIVQPGLHVGTREQAEARWPGKRLYQISLGPVLRVIRLQDRGSWTRQAIQTAARRAPMAVYLNRYEGLPITSLDAASRHDNDNDRVFRKNVEGASDSWIILNPDIIEAIQRVA